MKTIILFLSIFATSCTIRVPVWNDINENVAYRYNRPRISEHSNRQLSFQELDDLVSPNNQGWSPVLPKSTVKKTFYKKPLDSFSYNKKNPLKQSSTKNINVVPFNTKTYSNHNNIFKPFPQTSTTFEHRFQPQASTHINPFDNDQFFKIIPKPETKLPQNSPQSLTPPLANFYDFKPLQDLDKVEDAFFKNKNNPKYISHLNKNYRDDKTHEPNIYDDSQYKLDNEELKVERYEHEKAPISTHEIPADIPTKPIYPGQGLWAKPGIKHRPFISQQKYDELEEDKVKPDGYDTFETGQKLFENNNKEFSQNLQNFPKQHKFSNIEQKEPTEDIDEEEINEESGEEDDEFVPMKLYAQVRASENTKYLPENEDDGRLRETIKESKVHTVYTEEGYEDSAYDHAGHEKEATNDEGFEDLQREKIEKTQKKPPHTKFNLHMPKVSTIKYSVGNGVLSDEEIEKIKEEELGIADADVAGTNFEEIQSAEDDNNSGEIVEEIFSTNKPMKENKNFITTKETKTMKTKEKDNGNTETEFSSKINIVLQPNNSTETQKYEKIYPKVYKTIQRKKIVEEPKNPLNFSGIFIEEIITSTSTPPTEELPDEIPITTIPTTAIPKPNTDNNLEALESISKDFSNTKSRVKRYTNDYSDIRLNSQFLPSINHELGKIKEDKTHLKYPYYDKYEDKGIHENSPLRYSEDLKNIPSKTGRNMVLYGEGERKIFCPEIRQTVNAIPERVLNKEKENETEDDDDDEDENTEEPKKLADQPQTPRLSGLGDQIDCLKVKYFGENPLDSPIFKEETIAPPAPIFNILNKTGKKIKNEEKQFGNRPEPTQNTGKISTKNEINDNDIKTKKLENQEFNPTTPKSIQIINLLTTPKYTVTLKPKHIYHQIKLLDYLPEETNIESEVKIQNQQTEALDEDSLNFESSNHHLLPNSAIRNVNSKNGVPFLIFDVNRFIPDRSNEEAEEFKAKSVNATSRQSKAMYNENEEEPAVLPEAEEWRRRKIRKRRPPLQIFDVNKFLPTTPFPIFNEISTVLPKYKVESEVFYKDQILPNEQLHVLTDILNNIKNSSQEQPPDASIQSSEPVSISLPGAKNHKSTNSGPHQQDSYLQAYGDQEVDVNYYSSQTTSTSTTTKKPVTYRRNINHRLRKRPSTTTRPTINPAIIRDREEKFKLYLSLLEAKKKPQYPTSTVNNDFDYGITIPVTEKINEYIDQTTKVMGLMPPNTSTQRYKTISHPKRDNSQFVSNSGNKKVVKINKFYVMGMRPPPEQKIMLYPDFTINKKHKLIRGKRSTSSYAALSRQQEKPSEVADSEEDDAPHRPKNYYYDEKTGKIVYLVTEKPESSEEDEEEVEYEEIIEQPPSTTSKPLQDPVFATATPPPKGKSFVDFVSKLHNITGYKNIPDPTTTEKGKEATTIPTTTIKPESTTPPAFLNFVNKIRQNSQYKVIEDKKENKIKTTTTETPEKIEEEEDEEEDEGSVENIQNSPGGSITDHYKQLGIFDVTDYIPKIKHYLPKTSFDISKYQTIARSTSKTTTEDDTDSAEETTTSTSTTQKPLLIITEVTDSINEATVNEETEKTPMILQRRRLKTTSGSTVTTEPSTTKYPLDNRRRRPTTIRSTSTINIVSTTEAAVEKVRRNYRRRPTRIQTKPHLDEDEENTTKIVRRRSDSTVPKTRNKNFVETFKTYHRNKKHGGNYRNIEDDTEIKNVTESSPLQVINNTNVEIIGDFDETKKHGGNYKSEEDAVDEDKEDIEDSDPKNTDDKLVIDLLEKQSDREVQVEVTTPKINVPKKFTANEEVSVSTRKPFLRGRFKLKNQKLKNIVTEPPLMRLTDIVPKPESFYKDPTLSRSVNMLESKSKPSTEDIVSILSSTESEDSKEQPEKLSKKRNIIKDPSKRLYYYAPI